MFLLFSLLQGSIASREESADEWMKMKMKIRLQPNRHEETSRQPMKQKHQTLWRREQDEGESTYRVLALSLLRSQSCCQLRRQNRNSHRIQKN